MNQQEHEGRMERVVVQAISGEGVVKMMKSQGVP